MFGPSKQNLIKSQIQHKPMEEEIITEKKTNELNKKTIELEEEKKEELSDNDDIKLDKKQNDNKMIYNLTTDDEKEISRIELKKNIVVRILEINDEKYIDFCKFYKGYPTKKNIRIKFKTYIKLNNILLNN